MISRSVISSPHRISWLLAATISLAPAPAVLTNHGFTSDNVDTAQVCAFDTAAATHYEAVSVGLAPGLRGTPADSIPADYLAAANAIRQHFHPPASLSLPLWARVQVRDSTDQLDVLGRGLDSQLSFRVDANGRLAAATIVIATASSELNASLAAAVRRADSAGAFGPPSREVHRRRGWIELRLVDWTSHEGPGVGLVRVQVPVMEVEAPAVLISVPPPMYPGVALQEWVGDSLSLQYVVLENGKVDANSFRLITGRYVEFFRAAIVAVKKGRFKPARVRGCPVPSLVQQRITFQIHS